MEDTSPSYIIFSDDRKNQQVYYQGKAGTHTYQPLDFLAYVSLHIPDKGEQIVRYYGWYSLKVKINSIGTGTIISIGHFCLRKGSG